MNVALAHVECQQVWLSDPPPPLTRGSADSTIGPHEPVVADSRHEVTQLLRAWTTGDLDARDRALGLLYRELRRRAAAQLRRERPGHSLQATALVHEAYLRLDGQRQAAWQNRAHFLAVASQMMRRILVDRARARQTGKRAGRGREVTLDDAGDVGQMHDPIDLLDLDAALERLAALDARKSRIAVMKFFGGLSLEEMGEVLELSSRTVERDWQAARAWLFKALAPLPRRTDDES
jgi:RNA polymerase sigma factor (TIGR02999 family)